MIWLKTIFTSLRRLFSIMSIKFTDNSGEVLSALEKAVHNGLTAVGMTAERYAKKDTPVDTGRLRNSITYEVRDDEQAVYIGTNVEYAPYVELGTSRMAARPFLRPAATEHGEEYKGVMEAAMKSANG